MMRFLRGTFFRIGGILYNDFEDINVQEAPPPVNLAQRFEFTAGMNFGSTSMFTREYVPPPPRAIYVTADAFDRGVGPLPLGSVWDYPAQSGVGNRPQIVSNHVIQNNINLDCCAWSSGASLPNGAVAWEVDVFRPEQIIGQYSQIVIQDPLPHTLGTNYVGVVARCSSVAAAKFYIAQVAPTATAGVYEVRLLYWNGSSFVGLTAPNSILNWAVGDVLRLEVTGKGVTGNPVRLKLLKNTTPIFNIGVAVGAAGSIPGGNPNVPGPGIAIRGDGAVPLHFLDAWSGGELRPPADHLFHRENWNQHADGPLGQPWGFPFPAPNRPRVNNHQVVALGPDAYNVAYYGEAGFNASNQYSQVQLSSLPALENEAVGVVVRAAGGVDALYMGLVYIKGGALKSGIWYYWNDGTNPPYFRMRIEGSGVGIAAGGILRAEVTGTSTPVLNLYFNGILIRTYTFNNTDPVTHQPDYDVRIGGFPGFIIFDPTGGTPLKLDNWEGGKL